MQNPPEQCSVRNYIIDPYQIHFLRFIMEAYPGVAVVTTVDPKLGLVSISVPPGCEEVFSQIIEAETETLKLRLLDGFAV